MSAFYDLASLVVVPSGYKASKVYAQKPLTTDGQLTFSRASTATRVNSAGLIETVSSNVPRLDYTNSSCPKLLLEKQSTNYFTNSAPMVTTGWSTTGVTLTAGQADPAGGTGALRVQMAAGSSSMYRIFGYAAVSYARSAYMKANTAQSVRFEDPFTGNGVVANLTTQWQRFSFAEVVAIGMGMQFTNANDNAAKDFFLAFPQIEESTYATSFIPTTTSAVTRLADACSKTGISSLTSASEYTIYWEGTHIPTGQYNSFATFYNNANGNYSARFYRNNTNNEIRAAFFNPDTGLSLDLASGVTTQTAKCAIRVKAGSYAFYINGALVNSSTSALAPASNLDAVNLQYFNSGQSFDQKTGQVLFFKTALTNAQLAELTAL